MNKYIDLKVEGHLAFVGIDNPPLNVTSTKLRSSLLKVIEEIELLGVEQVILYGKGHCFIAGGDISEFDSNPKPDLPSVVSAIISSKKTWIASLHGLALGGGFEIAMACDFRIAQSGTQIAMPEVKLGIIPGAFGTQLLPRLIGYTATLEMCLDGKSRSADTMLKLGGIDAIFEDDPLVSARLFSKNLPRKPRPIWQRKVYDVQNSGKTSLDVLSKYNQNYIGPKVAERIIEAIDWSKELSFTKAIKKERKLHLRLRRSDEAIALRHIFFAQKATFPSQLKQYKSKKILRLGVIGGGKMGLDIAVCALIYGKDVSLFERGSDKASTCYSDILKILNNSQKKGKLAESLRSVMARFKLAGQLDEG